MTTLERSLEREMEVVGFLIRAMRPLRLKDFDPLINEFRARGDNDLFPLGRTTLKSALIAAVNGKLIRADRLWVGKRRIMFYMPRKRAHVAYTAWKGNRHDV